MAGAFTFGRGGGRTAGASSGGKPARGGRSFGFIVLLAAIAGLICASEIGHVIAIIAGISVIGLPIMIAMMAIPTFSLFMVFAWVCRRLLRFAGFDSLPLALVAAAGLMFAIPFIENSLTGAQVSQFLSADRQTGEDGNAPRFGGNAFGVYVGRKITRECDELCQRLLLSGAARSYIVAPRADDGGNPRFDERGTAWSLERRGQCPAVKLREGLRVLPVADKEASVAPMMLAAIARGTCLIEREASIGEADAIIWHENTREAATDSGVWPFANRLSSARLQWFEKAVEGRFAETWRQSMVKWTTLSPFLHHRYGGGVELRIHSEFARKKNAIPQDGKGPDVTEFLRQRLGLAMTVSPEQAAAARDGVIDDLLRGSASTLRDGSGAIEESGQALVESLFLSLGDDATKSDPRTLRKAIALLGDPSIELPQRIDRYSRAAFAQPDQTQAAMEMIFKRLDAILQTPPGKPGKRDAADRKRLLKRLSYAVAAIPDERFAEWWPRIRAVTQDRTATLVFQDQIGRAGSMGEAAIGDLFAIIDRNGGNSGEDGHAAILRDVARNHAMWTICRMGAKGRSALPLIEERIASGVIALRDSADLQRVANLVAAIGGDPRPLAERASVNAGGDETVRQTNEQVVETALANPSCRVVNR
jgi:type III secretory pathway component EscS